MIQFHTNLKKYITKYLLYFLAFCFLVFFIGAINTFLNHFLVENLISTYKNTVFNTLLLFALAVLIFLWLYMYGNIRWLTQLAVWSVTIYLVLLSSGYWEFHYVLSGYALRNWDIVVLALCLPVLFKLIANRKLINSIVEPAGFIEDLPVETKEQDNFNRSDLANEIAQRIVKTNNKKSFAIGILGEYGSGKTSFINLIKSQLNPDLIATMDFNPWTSEGSNSIQKDFFDMLSTRLYEIDPQISSLILDYSRKINGTDSLFQKFFKNAGLIGSLANQRNYLDDYHNINRLLEVSGKRLVIAIDDLDRLYKEEVLEVLRLIRNTGSFSNIFYLVAYERGYIDEAVSSLNANVNSSFLDKIFQMEIPLPKRQSEDLVQLLETHLRNFITDKEFEEYTSKVVDVGFRFKEDFAIGKIFRQARDVVKFINTFKITYQKIGDEVHFESLFILELIKFRFPLIYDRIYDNREEFIYESVFFNSSHDQYYELNTYTEDKESKLTILRTLTQEGKYNEAEIVLIGGLLKFLFFKWDRSKDAKNSIIYPMFFNRYFRYRLSANDISEKEFRIAFENGLPGLQQFIEVHAQKKMSKEVTARLFQVKAQNREEYELQVQGLFYSGIFFIQEHELRRFDYEALLNLLRNFEHDRDKKYYQKDESSFNAFVEKQFNDAGYHYRFLHELTYHAKKSSRTHLSKAQLVTLQLHYFNEYVKQSGLTYDAVHMLYWTSTERFVPSVKDKERGQNLRYIEPEMAVLFKTIFPHYEPTQFLRYSIEYEMREAGIYRIYREIIEMFNDPEDLRTLVAANNYLDVVVKEEYLSFLDSAKMNGFKQWTEFEFKTALRRDQDNRD